MHTTFAINIAEVEIKSACKSVRFHSKHTHTHTCTRNMDE